MAFGMVGMGQMGGNLALQACEKGFAVAGIDAGGMSKELVAAGVVLTKTFKELALTLAPPRVVFIYIPAGSGIDAVLHELSKHLSSGDVVVDGGNSYWGDSVQRQTRLAGHGIGFVDLGTSGGVYGARHGACFMAGGMKEVVSRVEPILLALATEGGYVHAGGPGCGHFVKLVHNGIEFGMMQAIGEGLALLEEYPQELAVGDILMTWRHGSVIRSWLLDLLALSYGERKGVRDVPAYVEDTGEVNWLIDDAMRLGVPVPIIAQSVMQLLASRDRSKNWARAIAMMRHGFGKHPFGADPSIAARRLRSRVGEYWSLTADNDVP
jgi:6-phosphogluconate dehydrogenase